MRNVPFPCTLSQAKGAVDYAVSWPLSSPMNGYRAGRKYGFLVGLLAGIVGVPFMVMAFIVGPLIGAAKWALA